MVKNFLLYAPDESLIICLSIYITILILIRIYHIKEPRIKQHHWVYNERQWYRYINLDLKHVIKVKVTFILLDNNKVKILAYSKYWGCDGCDSWFYPARVGKKEEKEEESFLCPYCMVCFILKLFFFIMVIPKIKWKQSLGWTFNSFDLAYLKWV